MTIENESIKRQIGVVGNKENTWKKYLYFENGILVGEQNVKIENGVEIPYEAHGPITHFLELPSNFEFEKTEKLRVLDANTGDVSNELIKTDPKKQECICIKLFNKTRNIGEIHKIINGIDIETKYYKVESGKEVYCERPTDHPIQGNFFAPIPASLDGPLSLYDNAGKLIITIPHQKIALLDGQTEIAIQDGDETKIKEMLEKISSLSEEDKAKLKSSLENKESTITTLEGKQLSQTPYSEIERAVDALISHHKS